MTAKVLMVQGASSSAGKSLLTAALCRIFARRGLRVAPFKAQNMSNNAAVCPDGSEIGRSQAVQAVACGLEPTAEMNPILIKPEADAYSQVIVMGRPWRSLAARAYYQHRDDLWIIVTQALDRLRSEHDLVVIEGAGSPAELNLRSGDIVNMAVARYAQAPVLLVGDIDRGGIFAQLLGTLWLLEPDERALVRGLLVNKFRGDPTLFEDGVRILEDRGDVPVLGVIPYLADLAIPEEDGVALEGPALPGGPDAKSATEVDIAIIRLPRIANFDDFDPLAAETGVRIRYVASVDALGRPAAIILPGTKSTVADLNWLRETGLARAVEEQAAGGVAVVGICGGYQMLGRAIHDPTGIESRIPSTRGLGLLPVETVFEGEKETHQATGRVLDSCGWLRAAGETELAGYEIHMGRTQGGTAWLALNSRGGRPVDVQDGAITPDGRIWGCYLHALFANAPLRRAWLRSLGWVHKGTIEGGHDDLVAKLDRLAIAVEDALDMRRLDTILREGTSRPAG